MLAEPVLLGLVVAPSWAGLALTAAGLAAFLARHPVKLALADRLRGTRHPRTAVAERIGLAYAAVAAGAVVVATVASPDSTFWIALALAAPFALGQLAFDVRHHGRKLAPELLGAVALAAVSAAIVLAGGGSAGTAGAAWAAMAAKAIGSVLYVRGRLRLDRGQRPSLLPALTAHAVAFATVAILAAQGHAPWLAVVAFAALLGRAAHGLSPLRLGTRARAVGFQELTVGLLATALIAAGYALGI